MNCSLNSADSKLPRAHPLPGDLGAPLGDLGHSGGTLGSLWVGVGRVLGDLETLQCHFGDLNVKEDRYSYTAAQSVGGLFQTHILEH